MNSGLFVGLMSGTSVDAIDAALLHINDNRFELLATHQHELPASTRQRISAISHAGENEIERLGGLDRELGLLFAAATRALLTKAGQEAGQISAIGSHGQTVRHRPPSGRAPDQACFTLQLGDPNTIAEHTGIITVADFRRRDIAAGGEGAPLAPAFHAAALATEDANRAIVNIGGIANASLLEGMELRQGFDTGPGNTLLDHWIERHRGERFDQDGQWASEGVVIPELLEALLAHPYFARSGPRSTGKEQFNLAWLDSCLDGGSQWEVRNVQSTLAELTAASIALGINASGVNTEEVYVCGGGAHNVDLMQRLQRRLANTTVATTKAIGIDPDWVEAATFAWLAQRTLAGLPGNAPQVTGARGPRILGGIFSG
jgi:anhydro-N-acetylmuramic acid kinase